MCIKRAINCRRSSVCHQMNTEYCWCRWIGWGLFFSEASCCEFVYGILYRIYISASVAFRAHKSKTRIRSVHSFWWMIFVYLVRRHLPDALAQGSVGNSHRHIITIIVRRRDTTAQWMGLVLTVMVTDAHEIYTFPVSSTNRIGVKFNLTVIIMWAHDYASDE